MTPVAKPAAVAFMNERRDHLPCRTRPAPSYAPLKDLPGRGAGFHTKQNPTGFHREETVMAHHRQNGLTFVKYVYASFAVVMAVSIRASSRPVKSPAAKARLAFDR
jgi:hypothetical protein